MGACAGKSKDDRGTSAYTSQKQPNKPKDPKKPANGGGEDYNYFPTPGPAGQANGGGGGKNDKRASTDTSSVSEAPPAKGPMMTDAQTAAENDVRKEPVDQFYQLGRELGRGGFSIVREGVRLSDGQKFAIKCIGKEHMEGEEEIKLLLREVQIMKKIDHPNVLKLYEVFEDEEQFYLVTELVSGKELFDKIVERGQYSEKDAANIVRQIISAVEYLHSIGIAHRDLKPENLLSAGDDEEEVIKIADFGFSKNFGDEKLKTSCGSPGYVAPEVLTNEDYDSSVDLWSIGVIIYILLCGYPPFYADNAPSLFKKIMECRYDFDDSSWDGVSEDAKDLIRHLLVKNPKERWTAKQCAEHAWVKGISATDKKIGLQKMREYNSQRNLGAGK